MRKTLLVLTIACVMVTAAIAANRSSRNVLPSSQDPRAQQQSRQVDLVIALDTSGSMEGLINAARQKLWDIVNEVARAKPTPRLRVGLVTFGSQGTEDDGYVIVRNDLTSDLDSIYSKLFELTTWGGTEYVGRVVRRATRELSWDKNPDSLRQIFVAGNESADQDRAVRASDAVADAQKRGIFVNTIYCGTAGSSEAAGWLAVANTGHGMYASIDHNNGTINVATPYDTKIATLSARLNSTYVAYGIRGRVPQEKQKAQDVNAQRTHSAVAAARAQAKASSVYQNADWDLVDARKEGKLGAVAEAELPAELRGMSGKDREAYLDKMEQTRKAISGEIAELSKKRQTYVATETSKRGGSAGKAFDEAIKKGIRKQAVAKGFRF